MTIPLTSTGSLFRRVGRIWYTLSSLNGWRGSADLSGAGAVSLGTGIDNIAGQYQSSDTFLTDGLYSLRDQIRNSVTGNFQLASLAANTIVQMADDDTVCYPKTLGNALSILISQMKGGSQTVKANTVGSSTNVGGSNVGNAVLAVGMVGPGGLNLEYCFAETLTATCIADAQVNTSAAGAETWTIAGDAPAPAGSLGWNWPAGSGSSITIAAKTASAGMLTGGDFETWSLTNVPDGWTINVGTAGTTVFQSTSPVFEGTSCLKITGDGSELTSLRQTVTLKPSTVYMVNCWQRVSAVPLAGVLSLEITDGASVINDDAGNPNAVTKDLTGSTTSFAALNGTFRTPSVLPSTTYFRLRLSTALDSAKSVYVDELTFIQPAQMYAGGPYVGIFAGSTNSVKADTFTATITNDWAGEFQKAFQAMFNLTGLGLQLPSAAGGGETISDTLID